MSNKHFFIVTGIVVLIISVIVGFRIWAKNELCKTYYAEMNRIACFMNDSILPQRTNR